jgi:hypothetical protein
MLWAPLCWGSPGFPVAKDNPFQAHFDGPP